MKLKTISLCKQKNPKYICTKIFPDKWLDPLVPPLSTLVAGVVLLLVTMAVFLIFWRRSERRKAANITTEVTIEDLKIGFGRRTYLWYSES